jgi:hypothetical protein
MLRLFRNIAFISIISIFFCFASEGQNASDLKTALSAPDHLAGGTSATASSRDEKAVSLAHPDSASVKEGDPVITIHGLCTSKTDLDAKPDIDKDENDPKSCTTDVTRRQFDSLLDAANVSGQQVSSLARQNFAKGYVLYLAFEQAARKAGFEDTEQFAELMRWARLRAVTDAYRGRIVEEARTAQQSEVDAYYKDHLDLYDRISIMPVSVPRIRPNAAEDKAFDQKAYAVMQEARQSLVHGDSPEDVQKNAYSSLDLFGPPVVDTLTRTRSDFPELKPEGVLALKAGDVSDIQKKDGSYSVYKIVSHDAIPESKVQSGIVHTIAEDKVRQAFESIQNSIQPDYNLTYFGPPQPAPMPAH